MRLRILTDLFRQKFVRKTLKYTKYSCGFRLFLTKNLSSDSLAELCGVAFYYLTKWESGCQDKNVPAASKENSRYEMLRV